MWILGIELLTTEPFLQVSFLTALEGLFPKNTFSTGVQASSSSSI